MKKILIPLLLLVAIVVSCQPKSNPDKTVYLAQVGDTSFDPEVDDPQFKICDTTTVQQYYNFGKGLQYKGEKTAITNHFKQKLKTKFQSGETGYITIRFIVNCEGKTGWFRMQSMDENYQEKEFDSDLVDNLLELTKQLDGWQVGTHEQSKYDYYQYLTFKIENGNLVEIMP
jgi:hypothetical protein